VSARELTHLADRHPLILAAVFIALPLAAWLCGRLHPRGGGGGTPWKYFYCLLVYLACVPGMFAGVLTAYTLFRRREEPKAGLPKLPGT